MMVQGNTMGVIDMTKALRQNADADAPCSPLGALAANAAG